jgi:hypothetical protein
MFTDTLSNSGGGGDHHHYHGQDTSAFTAVKYMVVPYQQPQYSYALISGELNSNIATEGWGSLIFNAYFCAC